MMTPLSIRTNAPAIVLLPSPLEGEGQGGGDGRTAQFVRVDAQLFWRRPTAEFSNDLSRSLPPTPALPLKGGGRESEGEVRLP